MAYDVFGLTLMVTHACNMRCHYCYTGEKAARRMPAEVGDAAIQRAIASLKSGGRLELGFFGGEPLLEVTAIQRWVEVARRLSQNAGTQVSFHLTTNGTIDTPAAWDLLLQKDLHLTVSFDGLPDVHDRFRVYADGRGTSHIVTRTIQRLCTMAKAFSVIMVARPETVRQLAAGIRHLRAMGVTSIEPSVDLWTHWTREDAANLRQAIAEAAELWTQGLPDHALNWFDEKAVALAGVPSAATTGGRCGFGEGEVAIAPSGNLYPCERLIGEDQPGHPMRLAGHVLDGDTDFSPQPSPAGKQADACGACAMHGMCNAGCRCSNYVRTGEVRHPDGLLCMINQACLEEVAERLAPADKRLQLLTVR